MMKNKRIAEFMYTDGFEHPKVDGSLPFGDYHTSWDWLMPVVQKCYDLEDEEMNNLGATADISMYLTDVDIQGVYSAVSEFIKQYTITQNQDDEQ
jgi:hypothetical protein